MNFVCQMAMMIMATIGSVLTEAPEDGLRKSNQKPGTPECCLSSDCSDYRGHIAKTESGKDCQPWNSEEPHRKEAALKSKMNSGELPMLTENFCRNPTEHETVWCYTVDQNTRWENCKIPSCSGVWTTLNESGKLQKLKHMIQEYSANLTAELSRKLEYSELKLAYWEDHIAAIYHKVSWICQTGNVSCQGNCGGRDDDGTTDTYTNYVVDVSFRPKFTKVPEVTLATNMLWTKSMGKNDNWGFKQEVKVSVSVSVDGFKAYLWAWDSPITWHGATWIACGKA